MTTKEAIYLFAVIINAILIVLNIRLMRILKRMKRNDRPTPEEIEMRLNDDNLNALIEDLKK